MADASKPKSPEKKALDYALNTLGVNLVYEQAVGDRALLQQTLDELRLARAKKRDIEDLIADRELDLFIQIKSENPALSMSAQERLHKEVTRKDDSLRELRRALGNAAGEVEQAETDRRLAEHDISIGCARMHELGGMLQFMAALKLMGPAKDMLEEWRTYAANMSKPETDPTDPWQQPAAPGPNNT